MREWREKTLGEFVSLQRGHDLPTASRGDGKVPVVGSFGITGYHNVAKAKGPGVTVGRSGASAGTVVYVQEDYWPHNTCLFVKDFHGNNPRFAYYLLSTLDLASHAAGSAQPSLNRNHIAPLPLLVPDRPEQDDIAAVLSALDDKIELNRRMNESLEALAQAIFKDWFVDFGPTSRKREGATDSVAILGGFIPEPAKAAPAAALFPDSLGEDGLPEGWGKQTIENVLELAYGKSLPVNKRIDGDIPVYGSGGVTGTHDTPLVKGPGIVIGRKGTVGSRYWEQSSFYPIDTVFFVRPRRNAHLEYIWELLSGLALEEMNTDAAVPGLNRNNVYRLEVSKPPKALVDAFQVLAKPIRARIEHNKNENRTLAEIRNYLLPKLLSGSVRVRDSDAMAE